MFALPSSWQHILCAELDKPYLIDLHGFLVEERRQNQVFPAEADVFAALECTPFDQVKVLLLGQDPYHDDGQAHGLCFSVPPGIPLPPSLSNIFIELANDLGQSPPDNGCLIPWARQGVLLLNAVLTVRAHEANSHKNRGWEQFTDVILEKINRKPNPVVFVLWGAYAQKKVKLIDTARHTIMTSAHPSPLSAHRGFFGSRPFSAINRALIAVGQTPIDWKMK